MKVSMIRTHELLFFIAGTLSRLIYLPFGIDKSDCPLPCEIYSTDAKVTSSASSGDFIITFQQDVEV